MHAGALETAACKQDSRGRVRVTRERREALLRVREEWAEWSGLCVDGGDQGPALELERCACWKRW